MLRVPATIALIGGIFASALIVLLLGPFSAGTAPAADAAGIVPGRYIVMMRGGTDPGAYAQDAGRRYGFRADAVYRHAIRGFAGRFSQQALDELRADPNVLLVEPDRRVRALPQTLPTGVDRVDGDSNGTAAIAGDGGDLNVDVAVIDTGVDIDHPDLNVVGGARFAGFVFFCGNGSGSYDDDNGHGTHVAGTIGARDNGEGVVGMAPSARIWSVKALDASGSGYVSCLVAAIDWVTANAATIEVANISIGAPASSALCTAITNSVAAGVVYAVAAGNSATNAQNTSPANCTDAIAVSAIADFDGAPGGLTDQTVTFSTCTESEDDSFACFSNYGSVVDVAAPGVNILSTYPGGGYATSSGTSMASPHVAGAAALYMVANGLNPANAAGVASFRAAFLSAYTVPRDSGCGFTGDPDSVAEPMLYVGAGCTVPNPTPTPTPTPTPIPTPTPTPTPTPEPTPAPTPPPDGTVLYFSLQFNQTVGGVSTANEDIIAFDGANVGIRFDGSDVGLGALAIDAFSLTGPNEVLMSFTNAAAIPGIAGIVDDSDVVKFTATSLGADTTGSFSLYFDASDVGLATSTEDVDAVELLPDGRVLVSVTGAFVVDGVSGEDEDVIALTPSSLGDTTAGIWAMYFDGSDVGLADTPDEDVDALAVAGDGTIYMSVVRAFSVAGLSGSDEDVFACNGATTGGDTSCGSFSMLFDGSAFGLTSNDVIAIDLP